MTDIQTGWNIATGNADWVFLPGNDVADATNQLSYGNDLATAVVISLFTDAQAGPDDTIPDGSADPRGWWAGPIGSKIWIYASRSKATAALPAEVQQSAADALQWLIDDGVATVIDTNAFYDAVGSMVLTVTIHRGNGASLALQFANFWDNP